MKTVKDYLRTIEIAAMDKNLSMAAACRLAGIQPALFSHWKHGKYEPKLSSLNRLEAAIEDYGRKQEEASE